MKSLSTFLRSAMVQAMELAAVVDPVTEVGVLEVMVAEEVQEVVVVMEL